MKNVLPLQRKRERWHPLQKVLWTYCKSKKQVTAGVAQLVEHNLAKVGVASPSLVSRSYKVARMAELVDAQDLKSCCQEWQYRFDAGSGYEKDILT